MKVRVLKLVALVVVTMTVFVSFTACSNDGKPSAEEPKVEDIMSAMEDVLAIPDQVRIGTDVFYTFYDISETDVEEVASIKSGNGANADEVTVIKAATGKIDVVKKALEDRIGLISSLFEEYNPEDKPKIDNATVVVNGNYAFVAVCENSDDVKKIFEESFK